MLLKEEYTALNIVDTRLMYTSLATHQINDANAIPALHDREKRNKCRDYPAPSEHYSNAQWSHLVPVNQRLAADSIVPARRQVREQPSSKETSRSSKNKTEKHFLQLVSPAFQNREKNESIAYFH